jgi:NADH dehydrogenase FAD-containing subunit
MNGNMNGNTAHQAEHSPAHRIVIVGAGFGGLTAAQALASAAVSITVIDKKNYHTFQPLLYQVATAGLSPGEIAAPIRSILRRHKNVEVLMAEVTGFDLERHVVQTVLQNEAQEVPYDSLIVAAGASHAYFGHDEWEPFAPGLKTPRESSLPELSPKSRATLLATISAASIRGAPESISSKLVRMCFLPTLRIFHAAPSNNCSAWVLKYSLPRW